MFLFLYLHRSHQIDQLRIELPALRDEVEMLHEKNAVLQYEVDRYESPAHLIELHRQFRYLKHPREHEVMIID